MTYLRIFMRSRSCLLYLMRIFGFNYWNQKEFPCLDFFQFIMNLSLVIFQWKFTPCVSDNGFYLKTNYCKLVIHIENMYK